MLSSRPRWLSRLGGVAVLATCLLAQAQQPWGQQSEGSTRQGEALPPFIGDGPGGGARIDPGRNLMSNPYRMIENWPTLNPGMKWGAAINFLPDNKGGTWVLLRTEPPINYFDASGKITCTGEKRQLAWANLQDLTFIKETVDRASGAAKVDFVRDYGITPALRPTPFTTSKADEPKPSG